MNKPTFDSIMKSIKMKESTKIVSFLDNFEYLKPLTFQSKSKLGLMMTEKECSLNHVLFTEGNPSDYIYFIKEGEFEVTKELFVSLNPTRILKFRRMWSDKGINFLQKLFNIKTQILVSNTHDLLLDWKSDHKSDLKFSTRISVLNKNETIGITECIVGCPYRITNVKWVSLKAKYMIITKDNFFRRVKDTNKELLELVVQKLDFLEFRIRNQAQVSNSDIDPLYMKSSFSFNKQVTKEDSIRDESEISENSIISK